MCEDLRVTQPPGAGMPTLQPRPVAFPPPARIEPVPGTPYGLAILPIRPITTGLASGGLIAGVGALLVSAVVVVFALAGASGGWGALAAGAFAVLSSLLGIGAVVLGLLALRQIRRSSALTGRGLAITGLICGFAAVLVTVIAVISAIVFSAAQS
jgi:hypothetical protein